MKIVFPVRFAVLVGSTVAAMLPGAALAQRAPRVFNRPVPRTRPERGNGKGELGSEAPKRDSEQQIDRLEKMSQSERRTALDALPQERREKIEKRLDHLQRLSPEQRAQLEKRLERFQNLPSDRQAQIRRVSQDLQQLPKARKIAVRQELDTLRTLPEGERQSRLESSTWKKQFSPQEQEILKQSSELLPQQP